MYWPAPLRDYLLAWLNKTWPDNKARHERMSLSQMRAIWHKVNRERYKT